MRHTTNPTMAATDSDNPTVLGDASADPERTPALPPRSLAWATLTMTACTPVGGGLWLANMVPGFVVGGTAAAAVVGLCSMRLITVHHQRQFYQDHSHVEVVNHYPDLLAEPGEPVRLRHPSRDQNAGAPSTTTTRRPGAGNTQQIRVKRPTHRTPAVPEEFFASDWAWHDSEPNEVIDVRHHSTNSDQLMVAVGAPRQTAKGARAEADPLAASVTDRTIDEWSPIPGQEWTPIPVPLPSYVVQSASSAQAGNGPTDLPEIPLGVPSVDLRHSHPEPGVRGGSNPIAQPGVISQHEAPEQQASDEAQDLADPLADLVRQAARRSPAVRLVPDLNAVLAQRRASGE